jgi:hypothetical protein
MKCLSHTTVDAVGICAYCGRALCFDCLSKPATKPLTCSPECAEAVARNEKALERILHQTLRSAQASAFYCYICAALSAGAAIVAWFMLPSPFLILFTGACAVVLLLSGIWYGRVARKTTS